MPTSAASLLEATREGRKGSRAALVACCLALAAAPALRAEEPAHKLELGGGGAEPVELTADALTYDWDKRVLRLEGHVVVTRADGVLRAARGVLDRAANTLRLEGHVFAVQGHQVALADAALLDLTSRASELTSAVMYLKQDAPASLRTLTDPAAARGLGKNAFTLTARAVQQLSRSDLIARQVTITPCDCAGRPDFEILSPEAHVTEDRVALSSPRLRMGAVTLPLFPLSLPLGERQSGMLFPQLGFSGPTGLVFGQPVFVVLGRSYDMTLTPGFFTGSAGSPADGTPASSLASRAVKGPRLGLEFRYAPRAGTQGELALNLLQDLDRRDSAAEDASTALPGEPLSSPGRGLPFANGLRGVLRFSHRTEEGPLFVAAQGTLASDIMFVRDAEPPTPEKQFDSLRTDLGIWAARGALTAGVDATLLQDVRLSSAPTVNWFNSPDRRGFGAEALALPARLPAAFAQLAPTLLGPFTLGAELSATRFQSLGNATQLERDTGYGPTDTKALPQDASTIVVPGDPQGLARGRVVRLDAAPTLGLALPAGLPLWGRASVGARTDAWLFENDGERDTRRAYAIASAEAGTTLSRAYGHVLHTLSPMLQVRALSAALRSGGPPIGDPSDAGGSIYASSPEAALQGLAPGIAAGTAGGDTRGVPAARRPYDEIDLSAPEQGAGEGSLRLLQALWTKGAPGHAPARLASLELRQDFVLWLGGGRARAGEASAHATINLGGAWAAEGGLRYDWKERTATSASAHLGAHSERGDEAHVDLLVLDGSASSRARAGIDELFGAVQLAQRAPAPAIGHLTLGGSWSLPGTDRSLRLSADINRYLGLFVPGDNLPDWSVTAGFGYETPCRCAAFLLGSDLWLRDGRLLRAPSFRLLIDLKTLGTVSTF